MTSSMKQGLIKKHALTDAEIVGILQLAHVCNTYENLHMRIDWIKVRAQQSDVANDFLYYADGALAGYLMLDSHGRVEKELTGMVHPDYRRRGIFRALLAAAKAECFCEAHFHMMGRNF